MSPPASPKSPGRPTKVAVIGAGPAGLAAAYELAKKGVAVEVFEAGDDVGGMAKTIELWGQLVDLGPHRFFSSDPRVNGLWLEVVGRDYEMIDRLTRIYYRRTFFDYPLKALNALRNLGPFEAARCLFSYFKSRFTPIADESTFENWVVNRFGRRLFEIFFKSYSEKLWGISCNELDADFAAQRIKKLSLMEAIKSAFRGKGQTKHKTLVDQFAYPFGGTGSVYRNLARRVAEMGGTVHLNQAVSAVVPMAGAAGVNVEFRDGQSRTFDHVVSSMPITALVARIGAPVEVRTAAQQLKFRNTILVYLEIAGDSPFPDQWIYVHSAEMRSGRITNFRNWLPALHQGRPNTILCLEYWCYDGDPIWSQPDDELVAIARAEAYTTSLVRPGTVLQGKVVRVPKCYPVYARGYRQYLKPVEDYLSTVPGLTVIGRYGAFKYNNQDHSILMGILAAENIADGAHHNLWDINTDYEYQETSVITKTGLQKK